MERQQPDNCFDENFLYIVPKLWFVITKSIILLLGFGHSKVLQNEHTGRFKKKGDLFDV